MVVGLPVLYQIKPFSSSDNGDALVCGVMAVLTAGLILLPWISGLRRLPRYLGLHRVTCSRPRDRHRTTASVPSVDEIDIT